MTINELGIPTGRPIDSIVQAYWQVCRFRSHASRCIFRGKRLVEFHLNIVHVILRMAGDLLSLALNSCLDWESPSSWLLQLSRDPLAELRERPRDQFIRTRVPFQSQNKANLSTVSSWCPRCPRWLDRKSFDLPASRIWFRHLEGGGYKLKAFISREKLFQGARFPRKLFEFFAKSHKGRTAVGSVTSCLGGHFPTQPAFGTRHLVVSSWEMVPPFLGKWKYLNYAPGTLGQGNKPLSSKATNSLTWFSWEPAGELLEAKDSRSKEKTRGHCTECTHWQRLQAPVAQKTRPSIKVTNYKWHPHNRAARVLCSQSWRRSTKDFPCWISGISFSFISTTFQE